MHEIGIANAIIEAGQAEAARRTGSKLVRIGIRIGTLAGVDSDALRFAFTALTQGTELDTVDFEIQSCPRRNRCLNCDHQFETAVYSEPCPLCASETIALVGGEELDLTYVELEEA
ncbi:hydrogenase nickel incorporation protein HypA/HybF [Silvibacterium bohemicum]|jgi:hydrogenase nickel incorporation protein HypA/HybF|uniref:Hydrogenase maturation factor HypA n=1 Tax=Silvibacterium bohemicum TaxID=1577686 RepID=A0A841JXX9_9BACT|nr:hydrogenase maturation nickel metallochaperone HypA [Silvibacterium bohemicum]MBB6143841.1 hydrogenase nickel incorporation protein HypA/HybF [Silvibacterium bohemicum]